MKKIWGNIKRIKEEILKGENLDNYAAVVFGLVFTFLGFFGNLQQSVIDNFILVTLTLLLLSSLNSRYQISDIKDLYTLKFIGDASLAIRDQSEYDSMEARLSKAKNVVIVGKTLSGFIGFYKDTIIEYCRKGCSFFIVISSLEAINNDESLKINLINSLSLISEMKKYCGDKLIVKETNNEIVYSIFGIDIEMPKGLIQIQPQPYNKSTNLKPHLDFRAYTNSQWYAYFKSEIQYLLENSKNVF